MCGIVGFIGKSPEKVLLDGLKRLEYRGYDSAGIALKNGDDIELFKAKGEIRNLEKIVPDKTSAEIGVGHTRWATHGKPDEINAHPHVSSDKKWAIVHNGIIENYLAIKAKLNAFGYEFYSETDTETVAKLLEYYQKKGYDEITSLNKTVNALKGSYALGIINKNSDCLYFAKNKSPLFLAKSGDEIMLASDIICFKGFAKEYYPLVDGIFGFASKEKIVFYDNLGETEIKPLPLDLGEYDNLNTYKHFMIKEIYDTKTAIKNIIEYYGVKENCDRLADYDLSEITKVKFVGCGTAYHACLLGANMLFEKTGIDATSYVASEFRYGNLSLDNKTMVVLVSQSGETADTLAAFERAKESGAFTVGIVNVEYSTLSKKVDVSFPIKAGVEIAVASTKAFSSQLCVLNIFAGIVARKLFKSVDPLADVRALYEKFDYGNVNDFKLLADVLRYNDKLFMIGRGDDYCVAQEACLKIKETSYINSNTYYAGELKHGFLALIDEQSYVVVFATNKEIFGKTVCNAEEAKARGGKIILFTCFDLDASDADNFYYIIKTKELGNSLQAVLNIIPWQIIAYYISVNKGINPDKPRNLAKSVTVE
ncbi:MAG: glutamine--fructose-6-phosphate transaminase (isomerizing) [Clostridia bacterium]|nr:glutamine--fructose-6-phosphate transaminase (isomerizing) [Clostridia bacterium]